MIQILVAMFEVYARNLIAVVLSGSADDRGSWGLAITGEELAALQGSRLVVRIDEKELVFQDRVGALQEELKIAWRFRSRINKAI